MSLSMSSFTRCAAVCRNALASLFKIIALPYILHARGDGGSLRRQRHAQFNNSKNLATTHTRSYCVLYFDKKRDRQGSHCPCDGEYYGTRKAGVGLTSHSLRWRWCDPRRY